MRAEFTKEDKTLRQGSREVAIVTSHADEVDEKVIKELSRILRMAGYHKD